MSDLKERKPDGGLAELIQWHEMVGEDGDPELLCLLLELRRRRVDTPAPSVPDAWATVPAKLSADNGAKAALSGEFLEVKFIGCPECFGDVDCDSCDGSGRVKVEIPVSWTTIKAIWEKGVQHFSAAPASGGE